MKKSLILKTAIALALAAPLLASAESNIVTGTNTTTGASADLRFRVIIPQFIALKVGTGAIFSNTGTVDTVEFALTDPQATTDGTLAATSGGVVSVALLSNVGNVNFSSTGSDLADTLIPSNTIPITRISATDTGTLAHPVFNAGAISVAPTSGRVINRTDTWTFSYDNQGATAPVGAGTYESTVTYTAAKP